MVVAINGLPKDAPSPKTNRSIRKQNTRSRLDRTTTRSAPFLKILWRTDKARKPLIDVRSPGEFKGEITHMAEYPQEGVLRGGHVPGAKSVPWKTAAKDDGTFKPREELKKIYQEDLGYKQDGDTIVYCRIGERSSHTWFILTKLLGFEKVRNYDGSWTEWGYTVRSPIEKS